MRLRRYALALVLLSVHCAALDEIPASTCGNGVVDPASEDCDTFPESCGKPGVGVAACRLTCDRSVAGSCPAGWGCSVEGVCRQPTGEFETAGAPMSAAIVALTHGDFDHDGRADIVGLGARGGDGAARAVAHFFGDKASLESQTLLPVRIANGRVVDFDRDGTDDIAFTYSGLTIGAFSLLSGRMDRTFAPLLFPANSRKETNAVGTVVYPRPGGSLPFEQSAAALLLVRDSKGTRLVSEGTETVIGLVGYDVPSPVGPEEVLPQVRTGHIFAADPTSTCSEVAFAVSGTLTSRVIVASPCTTLGGAPIWANARPLRELVVPGAISDLRVLDANGDGFDDVAAIFRLGTKKGVRIALSTGTTLDPFVEVPNIEDAVLAFADFDRDGVREILFSGGLLAQKSVDAGAGVDGGVSTSVPVQALRGPWSAVVVGRFNGDTHFDFAAIVDGLPDIELYFGGGDGSFNPVTVSTERAVRDLAGRGDLDGDGIDDLVFLESTRELGDPAGSGGRVGVAYGNAHGPPSGVRVLGEFDHARSVGFLPTPGIAPDGLTVLDVAPSSSGGLPTTTVTTLVASADRQVVAPLFVRDSQALAPLSDPNAIRFWTPLALAVGPMKAGSPNDVAAVCSGRTVDRTGAEPRLESLGLWLANGNAEARGRLDPFQQWNKLENGLSALEGTRIRAVATTGDVDSPKDGVIEVVAVSRSATRQAELSVLNLSKPRGSPDFSRVGAKLSEVTVSAEDQLEVFDVDGDGADDVVYLARTRGSEKLLVMFNSGGGNFSEPVPITTFDLTDPPVAFAKLTTTTTEIVVVRASSLAIVRPATGRTFEVRDLTPLLGTLRDSLTGVDAADYDGDGVADIAVAQGGAIRILRQKPRLR